MRECFAHVGLVLGALVMGCGGRTEIELAGEGRSAAEQQQTTVVDSNGTTTAVASSSVSPSNGAGSTASESATLASTSSSHEHCTKPAVGQPCLYCDGEWYCEYAAYAVCPPDTQKAGPCPNGADCVACQDGMAVRYICFDDSNMWNWNPTGESCSPPP
jgi:hypothetical protein